MYQKYANGLPLYRQENSACLETRIKDGVVMCDSIPKIFDGINDVFG